MDFLLLHNQMLICTSHTICPNKTYAVGRVMKPNYLFMDPSSEYQSGEVTKVIEVESEAGIQVNVAVDKLAEQLRTPMKTCT